MGGEWAHKALQTLEFKIHRGAVLRTFQLEEEKRQGATPFIHFNHLHCSVILGSCNIAQATEACHRKETETGR